MINPGLIFPRFGRVPKAEIYFNKSGRGSTWQRFKNLYARIQRGGCAAGPKQWEADHANRPRAGHFRHLHSSVAQGIDATWERCISGKWTSTSIRRGKPSSQTRDREITTGARHTKKSSEHLLAGIQMKYKFVEQHKQDFPIVVMCCVLGVSESGFYAWRQQPDLSAPTRRCSNHARDSTGV